jgi:hypothetical protein
MKFVRISQGADRRQHNDKRARDWAHCIFPMLTLLLLIGYYDRAA